MFTFHSFMTLSEILKFLFLLWNNFLQDELVVMSTVLMLWHEILDPFSHSITWDSTVLILFTLFKDWINLIKVNFFRFSSKLFGKISFVVIKHHHSKIFCLVLVKIITLIDIILAPDLVNNMFNKLFVATLFFKFEKEFCSVESLLVILPNENTKENLWDNICCYIFYFFFFISFIINNNSSLSIFHEFIKWSRIIIMRFFLVHQNTGQVDNME